MNILNILLPAAGGFVLYKAVAGKKSEAPATPTIVAPDGPPATAPGGPRFQAYVQKLNDSVAAFQQAQQTGGDVQGAGT